MNILFIGTANAAACATADRLYKEGDALTWITADKEEKLWNGNFRGKVYREGYKSDQIIRIMRLHSIDTVVFSFAGIDGQERWDENGQIEALWNTLQAAENYTLKHFAYFSTIELEYSQILTPRLSEYQYGEALCQHYQKKWNLPLLILRMGMVYGDYPPEKLGFVGELARAGTQGRELICRRAEDDFVDLIYADDAAMAVNLLLKLGKIGTYPVLTGHPIPISELIGMAEEQLRTPMRVRYLNEERPFSEKEYWEKSCPLKTDTGWLPFYLPREKGRAALERALHRERRHQEERNKRYKYSNLRKMIKRYPTLMGIAEALILFVLMQMILPFARSSEDLRFVDVRLFFVTLLSISFGMKIGMIATALACISYGHALRAEGIDITFLLYSVETWIPFIVYGIAGALFGYITDRKDDTVEEVEEKYGNIYERYTFLKEVHKEALEVKGNLQQQIIASKESFGKVYEAAQQLNSLNPDQVSFRAVEVVMEMMGGCQVAVWTINPQRKEFARRVTCTAELTGELPSSLHLSDLPLIYQGFEKENLFVNRDLDERYPDFAAPIYRNGSTIAFVAIYHLSAERFTLYYQNLFRMVTGLIENSLVKALEYEEKRRSEIYLPGTEFLNTEEFTQRLIRLEDETEKSRVTYLLLHIRSGDKKELTAISAKLQMLIRGNDFAGIDEDGNLCVVLINAMNPDYERIEKRFWGRGLEVELWN